MKKHIAKLLAFLLICSSLVVQIPTLEVKAANQAEALVSVARNQVGVKERSSNSDDILYNDWYYGRRVNNNGRQPACGNCDPFFWKHRILH